MDNGKFALLGYPLSHSMSPFIHERLFGLSGLRAEYKTVEVTPDEIQNKIDGFLNIYAGLNVTIPHKRAVIPFLSELDEKARLFGAVNTIDTGSRKGYNTDAAGFLGALEMSGIELRGRIAVCGTGGAGRTMALLAARNTRDLILAVRESDRREAELLVSEIAEKTGTRAEITALDNLSGEISLLINATPVGMYPHSENMPVPPRILKKTTAVFDAVYNPRETLLLQRAAAEGCGTAGGMPMLVLQAAEAHQIWYGAAYDPSEIRQLICDADEYLTKYFTKLR